MEVKFLVWFLFILCTLSLKSLGFEGFPTSKIEGFNLSEPKFGGRLHGVNTTIGLYPESDRRGLKGKQEFICSRKGQKGKGTYGGNNAHHPRSNKGPASLSSSLYFMSTAMTNASLAALIVFLMLGLF